jgi:hypothetical protein
MVVYAQKQNRRLAQRQNMTWLKMVEEKTTAYHFLEGGGEMGMLTRTYDWSTTSLGAVNQWPRSLCTLVDTILHAGAPMLLWWGRDLVQFYNDAYRPSLGDNGKHPVALGQRGRDCWPEIWNIIQPMIDAVWEGQTIYRENQLIPIFRNGAVQDVYWTFSYSPVRSEAGVIAGVLVVCHETTQQVVAMRKIEESETSFRSIILDAPVGICILDGDPLRADIVNDIFIDLMGKSRDEFATQPFWNIFPELEDEYSKFLQTVAFSGTSYSAREHKIKNTRKGADETVYVDVVIEPMPSAIEHLARKLIIIVIDVTDKVVTRQKIEESEHRYRTLISESTVAIALYTGPDNRIQYVNDIMIRYWGKDDSVIGKPLHEALPELAGQRFLQQLHNVYTTGQALIGTEEEAWLHVDGKLRPFYFNYSYKPLKHADGTIYGIHNTAMDVTEQVLARKKVEQSEAVLRNVILNAPVAMCILRGPLFVVEIANDRMFTLWGKQRDTLLNKPIFEGLPEVKHQGFEDILSRVYSTGESFSGEVAPISLPRKGTIELVYINFLYEAYKEADGTVSGVIAVATDVTEQVKARRRVEELVDERTRELAQSNKNLQRSNEELAQFAYIASHDLQEPARKITTFTEMLQTTLKEVDPRAKNLLNKVGHASSRMLALIRDILSYSQLARDAQARDRIDLNKVLQELLEDFDLMIEEKNAIIKSQTLPVIEGIRVQINQLFGNLLSNALKFSHKDRQPTVSVTVNTMSTAQAKEYSELKQDLEYYKISIADNGIGFNKKNSHQIFDIFQRLHGKADYEGTGIGLAMCKKIALNHYGDIVAESIEGEGATFHVFLPRGPS